MKYNNKQNSSPNINNYTITNSHGEDTTNLFSNPIINQKVCKRSDMMEIYNQEDYDEDEDQDIEQAVNKQTANKSQLLTKNEDKNKADLKAVESLRICKKHQKQLANLFCSQCLCYNICHSCISSDHSQHEILQFSSQPEMMSQTKQVLLQRLELTLQQLKSKENDTKNRMHQVNLIRNSLKTLQEQIVSSVSNMFRQIQGKLLTVLDKKEQQFGSDIDHFFKSFNDINDQLRQNLMTILDGHIDIVKFDKSMICKQAPPTPNFQNYKNTLQKYKKVLRDVKTQMAQTKKTIEDGYQSLMGSRALNSNRLAPQTKKFDKYIQTNLNKGDKASQSFIKTLKLIQNMPNQKQKGGLLGRKIF